MSFSVLSVVSLSLLSLVSFGAERQIIDWKSESQVAKGVEFQEVVPPECPFATFQYGERHEDIKDCGMDNCGSLNRFYQSRPDPNDESTWVRHTIESCADYCRSRRLEGGLVPNPLGGPPLGAGCTVFSYAPIGGDQNHFQDTVCTLHRRADTQINEDHGPNQIMCSIDPLELVVPLNCPQGFPQYGNLYDDVKNCGMRNCGSRDRYRFQTIVGCANFCAQQGCAVFSYASIGGDQNHPDDFVCTIHSPQDVALNDDHGPTQIMCRNPAVRPQAQIVIDPAWEPIRNRLYPPGGSPSMKMFAMAQKNAITIAAIGLFSIISGLGFMFWRKNRQNQNGVSYETLTEKSDLL